MIRKSSLIVCITGICLGVALCGCSLKNDKDSNLNLGMDAIEEENYSGAVSLFLSAIESGEDDKQSYRGLGIAYMGQGMYGEAINAFEKALSYSNGIINKSDIDISYYLAMSEYKSGAVDSAYNTYSAIIDYDDDAYEAYYLRGKLNLIQDKLDEAVEDYDTAVSIKNNDFDLYISIYRDLFDAGYEHEAEEYINKAQDNNSRISDYQSGMLFYYLGEYDEAKTYLERARDKNSSASLIMYLGKCYAALGDMNYATSIYKDYIDNNPSDASIYNELGLMYINQADYSGALSAFQKGLELNDSAYNQSLMFNEVVAYEYLTEYKKAAVLMKEYLDLYPTDEVAQREYVFLSTR